MLPDKAIQKSTMMWGTLIGIVAHLGSRYGFMPGELVTPLYTASGALIAFGLRRVLGQAVK